MDTNIESKAPFILALYKKKKNESKNKNKTKKPLICKAGGRVRYNADNPHGYLFLL